MSAALLRAAQAAGRRLGRRAASGGSTTSSTSGGAAAEAKPGAFSDRAVAPFPTLLLGFAGAAPFVAFTPQAAPWVAEQAERVAPGAKGFVEAHAARIQLAYGACILSFLGGPVSDSLSACGRGRTEARGTDTGRQHWGIAMTTGRESWLRYGWSVLPSLVAWPGLVVAEERPALGCGVVAAGLVSAYAFDSWAAGAGQLPRWYLANLRLPLTR